MCISIITPLKCMLFKQEFDISIPFFIKIMKISPTKFFLNHKKIRKNKMNDSKNYGFFLFLIKVALKS